MTKRLALPPLAFGSKSSQTFTGTRAIGDALADSVKGLEAVESEGPPSRLRSRLSGVQIQDVGLMACSTSPGRAIFGENEQLVFGFSFSGDISYLNKGITVRGTRHDCLFVADSCRRIITARSPASMIVVAVDRERLLLTARSMLGQCSQFLSNVEEFLPKRGHLRPLDCCRALPLDAFSGVFHAINALESDPTSLAAMAIDDHVHRLLVMQLHPEALRRGAGSLDGRGRSDAALEAACGFIEANLQGRITLTQLEQLTGLGARALQLSFNRRFQCSPTEWIRRRRLERVRSILLSDDPSIPSIRDVARRYGFLQDGQFARLYRRRFGELPSATVRRRHA